MSETQRLSEPVAESGAPPELDRAAFTGTADHTVWSCVGNRTAVRSVRERVRAFLERPEFGFATSLVDDAELAVSELATNALLHSRSGQLGGVMTLFIRVHAGCVRVAIADQGERSSDDGDRLRGDDGDYGRGKLIVDSCTDRNGEYWTEASHVAWFELDAD